MLGKYNKQNKRAVKLRVKNGLTDQDVIVIKLICKEMTSDEIAVKLGKSKRTIEGRRLAIMKIIRAKNNVGIVLYAIKEGIVEL